MRSRKQCFDEKFTLFFPLKVPLFIYLKNIMSITCYISGRYKNASKNREFPPQGGLVDKNRSHDKGKLSVYPTNMWHRSGMITVISTFRPASVEQLLLSIIIIINLKPKTNLGKYHLFLQIRMMSYFQYSNIINRVIIQPK